MFDRNRKPQPNATAALIELRPGVTREQIERALAGLAEVRDVQKYDTEFGGPVLYFP